MTTPPVLILGMHRSGTSCLAGSLQNAGLFLGRVNTSAEFNKKGNRESSKVMALHDYILKKEGGDWASPPSKSPVWSESDLASLEEIVKDFPSDQRWGVKDPRSLLLLDGWESSLSQLVYVGTFRHPKEVAESLMFRSKLLKQEMTQGRAFDLWLRYNSRLLEAYRRRPFDLIRYDISPDLYNEKILQVIANLGLDVSCDLSFRESSLHNQRAESVEVPNNLCEVWEELLAVAL